MITPVFSVGQDDDAIHIKMEIKYVKITKAEFYVDGPLFTFSLKPYFLSLTFSHELLSESEMNWSVYNPDTFELNCTV